MTELSVFVAAFLGSFIGLLAAVIPLIYYIKQKISTNPFDMMFDRFGDFDD